MMDEIKSRNYIDCCKIDGEDVLVTLGTGEVMRFKANEKHLSRLISRLERQIYEAEKMPVQNKRFKIASRVCLAILHVCMAALCILGAAEVVMLINHTLSMINMLVYAVTAPMALVMMGNAIRDMKMKSEQAEYMLARSKEEVEELPIKKESLENLKSKFIELTRDRMETVTEEKTKDKDIDNIKRETYAEDNLAEMTVLPTKEEIKRTEDKSIQLVKGK